MKGLCVGGGGIRGLIPARRLAQIERRAGERVGAKGGLGARTSTGGLLACGLTRAGADGRPRFSADELADIYVTDGPEIFSRDLRKKVTSAGGLVEERYDDDGLMDSLVRHLGEDRLSQALRDV